MLPYYTYVDGYGVTQTGKPQALPAVVTGTLTTLPANPLGIFYSKNNITLGDCVVPGSIVLCGANKNLTISGNAIVHHSTGMAAVIVPGSLQFNADAMPKSLVVDGLCWIGGNITSTGAVASNCLLQIDGSLMMYSPTASISGSVLGTINVNYVTQHVQVPTFSNVNCTPQSVAIVHWGM